MQETLGNNNRHCCRGAARKGSCTIRLFIFTIILFVLGAPADGSSDIAICPSLVATIAPTALDKASLAAFMAANANVTSTGKASAEFTTSVPSSLVQSALREGRLSILVSLIPCTIGEPLMLPVRFDEALRLLQDQDSSNTSSSLGNSSMIRIIVRRGSDGVSAAAESDSSSYVSSAVELCALKSSIAATAGFGSAASSSPQSSSPLEFFRIVECTEQIASQQQLQSFATLAARRVSMQGVSFRALLLGDESVVNIVSAAGVSQGSSLPIESEEELLASASLWRAFPPNKGQQSVPSPVVPQFTNVATPSSEADRVASLAYLFPRLLQEYASDEEVPSLALSDQWLNITAGLRSIFSTNASSVTASRNITGRVAPHAWLSSVLGAASVDTNASEASNSASSLPSSCMSAARIASWRWVVGLTNTPASAGESLDGVGVSSSASIYPSSFVMYPRGPASDQSSSLGSASLSAAEALARSALKVAVSRRDLEWLQFILQNCSDVIGAVEGTGAETASSGSTLPSSRLRQAYKSALRVASDAKLYSSDTEAAVSLLATADSIQSAPATLGTHAPPTSTSEDVLPLPLMSAVTDRTKALAITAIRAVRRQHLSEFLSTIDTILGMADTKGFGAASAASLTVEGDVPETATFGTSYSREKVMLAYTSGSTVLYNVTSTIINRIHQSGEDLLCDATSCWAQSSSTGSGASPLTEADLSGNPSVFASTSTSTITSFVQSLLSMLLEDDPNALSIEQQAQNSNSPAQANALPRTGGVGSSSTTSSATSALSPSNLFGGLLKDTTSPISLATRSAGSSSFGDTMGAWFVLKGSSVPQESSGFQSVVNSGAIRCSLVSLSTSAPTNALQCKFPASPDYHIFESEQFFLSMAASDGFKLPCVMASSSTSVALGLASKGAGEVPQMSEAEWDARCSLAAAQSSSSSSNSSSSGSNNGTNYTPPLKGGGQSLLIPAVTVNSNEAIVYALSAATLLRKKAGIIANASTSSSPVAPTVTATLLQAQHSIIGYLNRLKLASAASATSAGSSGAYTFSSLLVPSNSSNITSSTSSKVALEFFTDQMVPSFEIVAVSDDTSTTFTSVMLGDSTITATQNLASALRVAGAITAVTNFAAHVLQADQGASPAQLQIIAVITNNARCSSPSDRVVGGLLIYHLSPFAFFHWILSTVQRELLANGIWPQTGEGDSELLAADRARSTTIGSTVFAADPDAFNSLAPSGADTSMLAQAYALIRAKWLGHSHNPILLDEHSFAIIGLSAVVSSASGGSGGSLAAASSVRTELQNNAIVASMWYVALPVMLIVFIAVGQLLLLWLYFRTTPKADKKNKTVSSSSERPSAFNRFISWLVERREVNSIEDADAERNDESTVRGPNSSNTKGAVHMPKKDSSRHGKKGAKKGGSSTDKPRLVTRYYAEEEECQETHEVSEQQLQQLVIGTDGSAEATAASVPTEGSTRRVSKSGEELPSTAAATTATGPSPPKAVAYPRCLPLASKFMDLPPLAIRAVRDEIDDDLQERLVVATLLSRWVKVQMDTLRREAQRSGVVGDFSNLKAKARRPSTSAANSAASQKYLASNKRPSSRPAFGEGGEDGAELSPMAARTETNQPVQRVNVPPRTQTPPSKGNWFVADSQVETDSDEDDEGKSKPIAGKGAAGLLKPGGLAVADERLPAPFRKRSSSFLVATTPPVVTKPKLSFASDKKIADGPKRKIDIKKVLQLKKDEKRREKQIEALKATQNSVLLMTSGPHIPLLQKIALLRCYVIGLSDDMTAAVLKASTAGGADDEYDENGKKKKGFQKNKAQTSSSTTATSLGSQSFGDTSGTFDHSLGNLAEVSGFFSPIADDTKASSFNPPFGDMPKITFGTPDQSTTSQSQSGVGGASAPSLDPLDPIAAPMNPKIHALIRYLDRQQKRQRRLVKKLNVEVEGLRQLESDEEDEDKEGDADLNADKKKKSNATDKLNEGISSPMEEAQASTAAVEKEREKALTASHEATALTAQRVEARSAVRSAALKLFSSFKILNEHQREELDVVNHQLQTSRQKKLELFGHQHPTAATESEGLESPQHNQAQQGPLDESPMLDLGTFRRSTVDDDNDMTGLFRGISFSVPMARGKSMSYTSSTTAGANPNRPPAATATVPMSDSVMLDRSGSAAAHLPAVLSPTSIARFHGPASGAADEESSHGSNSLGLQSNPSLSRFSPKVPTALSIEQQKRLEAHALSILTANVKHNALSMRMLLAVLNDLDGFVLRQELLRNATDVTSISILRGFKGAGSVVGAAREYQAMQTNVFTALEAWVTDAFPSVAVPAAMHLSMSNSQGNENGSFARMTMLAGLATPPSGNQFTMNGSLFDGSGNKLTSPDGGAALSEHPFILNASMAKLATSENERDAATPQRTNTGSSDGPTASDSPLITQNSSRNFGVLEMAAAGGTPPPVGFGSSPQLLVSASNLAVPTAMSSMSKRKSIWNANLSTNSRRKVASFHSVTARRKPLNQRRSSVGSDGEEELKNKKMEIEGAIMVEDGSDDDDDNKMSIASMAVAGAGAGGGQRAMSVDTAAPRDRRKSADLGSTSIAGAPSMANDAISQSRKDSRAGDSKQVIDEQAQMDEINRLNEEELDAEEFEDDGPIRRSAARLPAMSSVLFPALPAALTRWLFMSICAGAFELLYAATGGYDSATAATSAEVFESNMKTSSELESDHTRAFFLVIGIVGAVFVSLAFITTFLLIRTRSTAGYYQDHWELTNYPPHLSWMLPHGCWMPTNFRSCYGNLSLIGSYSFHSVYWLLHEYAVAVVVCGIMIAVPMDVNCEVRFVILCFVYVYSAVVTIFRRPYRTLLISLLSAAVDTLLAMLSLSQAAAAQFPSTSTDIFKFSALLIIFLLIFARSISGLIIHWAFERQYFNLWAKSESVITSEAVFSFRLRTKELYLMLDVLDCLVKYETRRMVRERKEGEVQQRKQLRQIIQRFGSSNLNNSGGSFNAKAAAAAGGLPANASFSVAGSNDSFSGAGGALAALLMSALGKNPNTSFGSGSFAAPNLTDEDDPAKIIIPANDMAIIQRQASASALKMVRAILDVPMYLLKGPDGKRLDTGALDGNGMGDEEENEDDVDAEANDGESLFTLLGARPNDHFDKPMASASDARFLLGELLTGGAADGPDAGRNGLSLSAHPSPSAVKRKAASGPSSSPSPSKDAANESPSKDHNRKTPSKSKRSKKRRGAAIDDESSSSSDDELREIDEIAQRQEEKRRQWMLDEREAKKKKNIAKMVTKQVQQRGKMKLSDSDSSDDSSDDSDSDTSADSDFSKISFSSSSSDESDMRPKSKQQNLRTANAAKTSRADALKLERKKSLLSQFNADGDKEGFDPAFGAPVALTMSRRRSGGDLKNRDKFMDSASVLEEETNPNGESAPADRPPTPPRPRSAGDTGVGDDADAKAQGRFKLPTSEELAADPNASEEAKRQFLSTSDIPETVNKTRKKARVKIDTSIPPVPINLKTEGGDIISLRNDGNTVRSKSMAKLLKLMQQKREVENEATAEAVQDGVSTPKVDNSDDSPFMLDIPSPSARPPAHPNTTGNSSESEAEASPKKPISAARQAQLDAYAKEKSDYDAVFNELQRKYEREQADHKRKEKEVLEREAAFAALEKAVKEETEAKQLQQLKLQQQRKLNANLGFLDESEESEDEEEMVRPAVVRQPLPLPLNRPSPQQQQQQRRLNPKLGFLEEDEEEDDDVYNGPALVTRQAPPSKPSPPQPTRKPKLAFLEEDEEDDEEDPSFWGPPKKASQAPLPANPANTVPTFQRSDPYNSAFVTKSDSVTSRGSSRTFPKSAPLARSAVNSNGGQNSSSDDTNNRNRYAVMGEADASVSPRHQPQKRRASSGTTFEGSTPSAYPPIDKARYGFGDDDDEEDDDEYERRVARDTLRGGRGAVPPPRPSPLLPNSLQQPQQGGRSTSYNSNNARQLGFDDD